MENELLPIHPLALVFTIIAGVLMLFLPRRAAMVPLIFAIVFMPLQQRIVVASLDFFILRVLVLFGWARVFMRAEYQGLTINRIDKLMFLWVISGTAAYTLLWRTEAAFVNRLGSSFDIIGIYFLTRFLVRDFEDIVWVAKSFAVVSIPVATAMVIEKQSGRNLFSIFGGVPDFTFVRDGKLRCQGAFAHSITAGTFGASLLPVFVSLGWLKGHGKMIMLLGAISAAIITISSSSSGPAAAFMAGIAGLLMWRWRANMRPVRWGFAFMILMLHIVMKAPVWALLGRARIFGASTGYHRFNLFDQFVRRFDEWWLFGVKSTEDWGYYLFDVTNHFIRIAVDGGLLTLVLFIFILAYAFQSVGRAVKAEDETFKKRIYWALGASLFVHIVSFMGVSYFDQIKVVLYILLAMISALRDAYPREAPARAPALRLSGQTN